MLCVKVNDESFSYDIHSLFKAFYPTEDIKVVTAGQSTEPEADAEFTVFTSDDRIKIGETEVTVAATLSSDRPAYKSELKRQLYRALVNHTGRELPWGTLTGIRPTKLAKMSMDEGMDENEAVSHMKDFYLCSEKKAHLAADIAAREIRVLKDIAGKALEESGAAGSTAGGAAGSTALSSAEISRILADGYSLYIGIPFCPSRCLYCSFMSYPIAGNKDAVVPYLEAVKKEIDYVAASFVGRRLDSIYIGGGTPTTLSADELRMLIGHVQDKIDISSIKEFTVEAGRADSIDEEKLRALKDMGVDRISVNPQTLNEETLKLIGRKATAAETVEAYKLAREVGFDNINMDIILGLPGETTEDIRQTLTGIERLRPDDLTVHSLAVKRGSKLAEMLLEGNEVGDTGVMLQNDLIDYDKAMQMTAETADRMGLHPYYLYRQKNIRGNLENTGYAADGKAGIYNILMMEEVQDIVAVGAGTVSKRVYRGDEAGRIERCDTHKDLKLYIENIDEMIERKRRLYGQM